MPKEADASSHKLVKRLSKIFLHASRQRTAGPLPRQRRGGNRITSGRIGREPKTVQGILRHSRIQTTLDLYIQEDSDEARAAQGEFLRALGMQSELVQ
jgi:hypothetical protein